MTASSTPLHGMTATPPDDGFPTLSDDALYGLPGNLVQAIDPHTEAHPAAVLVNILVYFGVAVGDAPHGLVGSKRHTLNVNAVHVGDTSKGRKGTSMAEVDALFKEADPIWHDTRIMGGLSSGEGLIYNVRDASDKKDKDGAPLDEGVRDKRLLVVEEEFASVLKVAVREGNILSPVIRQAWDSGDLRTLTKNSPLHATGAHIGAIGHITRSELRRYLTETESGNGFANRFLWVCTRRSKILPDGGGHPAYGSLEADLDRALMFGRRLTQPLMRDEEARAIWHTVYEKLSDGKPGLAGAVTSRAEAQVLRLSLIYAVMDESPSVRAEHLIAALALWDYCEASACFIFGRMAGDPVADRILMALRDAGHAGLTGTDINDLFKGKMSATRLHATLNDLEAGGVITRKKEAGEGRTTMRYVVVAA